MWEIALLTRHYYPWVQSYARHIAHGAPSTGTHALNAKHARAQPHEIFEALDCSQHGFSFNPAMQKPKPHPLHKAKDDGGKGAPKRRIGLLNPKIVGASTFSAKEPSAPVRWRVLTCMSNVERRADMLFAQASKEFKHFFVETKLRAEKEVLEDQLSALKLIQSEAEMFRERVMAAQKKKKKKRVQDGSARPAGKLSLVKKKKGKSGAKTPKP